jgi:hypothetical protein
VKLVQFSTCIRARLSHSAPLATCEKAIGKENDYSADHATKEACGFSGFIPADSLAKIRRNERTYNSQNSRQNKAFRLEFVTRHNELGNHPNDKANYDRPKDAHPSAHSSHTTTVARYIGPKRVSTPLCSH